MAISICTNCIRMQFVIKNVNFIKNTNIKSNFTKLSSLLGVQTNYSNKYSQYSTLKKQETSQLKDNIFNVYYGVLTPQIKAVKVFSLITSITGCIAQPIIFQQSATINGGLPVLIAICSFVGFFTFVTPILLHLITKKYVTHLDYNASTDQYIATVVTFFLRQRKITFTTNDVCVPDVPGMFTSFLVKGIPLFVDPRLFPNPEHYGRIMGYDKPIDLQLGTKDKNSNNNKAD